jgi:hypothetical protein
MTEPPIPLAPSRSWRPGVLVTLAGSGLAAISVALAWGVQPFQQDVGLYPVSVSLPRLLFREAGGTIPNLGLVVVLLALLAGALAAVGERPGVEVVRRGLGVLVLGLVALFGFRYAQALEGLPPQFASFPGALRAGFYFALAGAVLTVVTGRPLRSPRPAPGPDEPSG